MVVTHPHSEGTATYNMADSSLIRTASSSTAPIGMSSADAITSAEFDAFFATETAGTAGTAGTTSTTTTSVSTTSSTTTITPPLASTHATVVNTSSVNAQSSNVVLHPDDSVPVELDLEDPQDVKKKNDEDQDDEEADAEDPSDVKIGIEFPFLEEYYNGIVTPNLPTVDDGCAKIWPKGSSPSKIFLTTVPPASLLEGKFSKYQLSSEAVALEGAQLLLLDPNLTHQEYQVKFTCHCGQLLHRNGWQKLRPVRSLGQPPLLLKCVTFNCANCTKPRKEGVKGSWFSILSPPIFAQLHEVVRRTYAQYFVVNRGSIISRRCFLQAMSLVEGGCPFKVIEDSGKETTTTILVEAELRRHVSFLCLPARLDALFAQASSKSKSGGTDNQRGIKGESLLKYLPFFSARAGLIARCYLSELQRQEPFIQAHLFRNAQGTWCISYDHTFPNGSKAMPEGGGTALILVNNNALQPVVSVICEDKSVAELKPMLEEVQEEAGGTISVVYTDCKKDLKSIMEAIPTARVVKDVFHIIQDLHKCASKKHKDFPEWVRALSAAFFTFCKEDLDRYHGKMIAKGVLKVEADVLIKDPAHLKKVASIRRLLNKPDDICRRINAAVATFLMKGLFTEAILPEIAKIEDTIRNFSELPENFCPFVNVGTEEDPIYRAPRGTTMAENMFLYMRSLKLHRFSRRMQHAIWLRALVRRSIDMGVALRKWKVLEHVYDQTLINDVIALERKFAAKNLSSQLSLFNLELAIDAAPESKFRSGFPRLAHGSTVTKAARLLSGASDREGPDGKIRNPDATRVSDEDLQAVLASRVPTEVKTKQERVLLFALIRTKEYFTVASDSHLYVDDESGAISEAFWNLAAASSVDEFLLLKQLSTLWNLQYVKALVLKHASLTIGGVVVEVKHLSLKETWHLSTFLKTYALGVLKKGASEAVKLVTSFDVAPSCSVPVISAPRLPAATWKVVRYGSSAPVGIPTIDPKTVNQAITSSSLHPPVPAKTVKKRTRTALPVTETIGGLDGGDGGDAAAAVGLGEEGRDPKKVFLPCPECGKLSHKKSKTLEATCAFAKWKDLPSLEEKQMISEQRKVHREERDAVRAVWLLIREKYVSG